MKLWSRKKNPCLFCWQTLNCKVTATWNQGYDVQKNILWKIKLIAWSFLNQPRCKIHRIHLFLNIYFIEVELIYNVVLISATQQSDYSIHIFYIVWGVHILYIC